MQLYNIFKVPVYRLFFSLEQVMYYSSKDLVNMLAGTTRGAGADTVRTSAWPSAIQLGPLLFYWRNSAHTNLVVVQQTE